MKGKNKGKLQFVQQFRKITAIQKLSTLKQGFGDLFFDNKADNNKFLRLKDQPYLTQMQLNYRNEVLCQNNFLHGYVVDNEGLCKLDVKEKIKCLNQEIEWFKVWAKHLTEQIKKPYSYRFKNQKVSPPVALANQFENFDALTLQHINSPSNKINSTNKNKEVIINQTQTLNNNNYKKKKRYDFNQITNYFVTDEYRLQDLDGNVDQAKKQMQHFRQYKTIQDINEIQQLKVDYEKFQYNIVVPSQGVEKKDTVKQRESNMVPFSKVGTTQIRIQQSMKESSSEQNVYSFLNMGKNANTKVRFKHFSILNSHLDISINFFRDLGTPSRNPEQFIMDVVLARIQEKDNALNLEQENPFLRQKIDTCLLHYLQPAELKIDKASLTFNDINNISMARLTSTNAHMCIRSEKVTRGQYEKLLRKIQKLYKMQHEDGKTRQNQAVYTDQILQDTNWGTRPQNTQNRPSIQKLVDEINNIRKQSFSLTQHIKASSASSQNGKSSSPFKIINERLFNDEVSKKMFSLLEELYKRVCDQLPFQYSILEIGFHVDQINGLAEQHYDRKRLIWFIMSVLQQIQRGKTTERNINYLQNKIGKEDQPRVIKYKGDRVVGKNKMGTKNLYQNNAMAKYSVRQKRVSPSAKDNVLAPSYSAVRDKSRTPVKNATLAKNHTPVKNASKSPLKSISPTQSKKPSFGVKTNIKQATTPNKRDTVKKGF